MKFLFCLLCLLIAAGCQQQQQPRRYNELAVQEPAQQAAPVTSTGGAADNPHAGLNMSSLTPDARAQLQKMLSEGQDPHAGIDMSAFGPANDPHAGLNMGDMAGMGAGAPGAYTWVLPAGWKQGPQKGMRLASFYIDKDPDLIDCYIVVLPGSAGGLEANLKRWMGQIGLDTSDVNYRKLLDSAKTITTQGGLQAKFYDLAALQPAQAEKSMEAAIILTDNATIFVKMTGTREAVQQKQEGFLSLLKSLSPKR